MSESKTTLPEALRMMADGVKPKDCIWDYRELCRIAATEIERLERYVETLESKVSAP